MAKQVLAASLWYHASFKRPSEQLHKQLSQQLRKLVASAQQASHSDDAVSLAQNCSQGIAHLPSAGPWVAQFPGELTSSLPLLKGGVGLVHMPTQIQTLQAEVVSRLLEPERLAWKMIQLYRLSQASARGQWVLGGKAFFFFFLARDTSYTKQRQRPQRNVMSTACPKAVANNTS